MVKFPLKFEVYATATEDISVPWNTQANSLEPITCAISPEFNGPGGAPSPEDLFALAVLNCILAMFKIYCEKHGEKFEKIEGKATVTMDQDPSINKIALTEIYMTLDVTGASDKAKVKQILESALRDCPVNNSIKSGKTYQLNVE